MNQPLNGDGAAPGRPAAPGPTVPASYPAPYSGSYPAPGYPVQMGPPMGTAGQPVAPYAPTRWPTWRIVDVVVTIVLFGLYGTVLLGLLYFSIFWAMATDSCGSTGCDYDKLDNAYALNDLAGVIVFAVTLVVAVVLAVLRKPVFWLPLLGCAIQVGLFLAAMNQLSGVSPN